MTKLTKEDALNIRDGDVVLVAMRVDRTNGFFDTGMGVKLTCFSPALDHRGRVEKDEKGPVKLDIMTSRSVHSVLRQEIRLKDWVEWEGPSGGQGKVLFIDGDEVTVRRRRVIDGGLKNTLQKLYHLRRVPVPVDLTDDEKKAFADAR